MTGTLRRTRLANGLCGLVYYGLAEGGMIVYRPYAYANDIRDLGLADTVGNLLGTPALVFLFLAANHRRHGDGLRAMLGAPIVLVAYEFVQRVIPRGTFDWRDVAATLVGTLLALLTYAAVHGGRFRG